MWQPKCRLTIADKFYGSQLGLSAPGGIGGTPNIDVPTFAETKPSIKSGYGLQTAQLNKFAANQPLLQTAEQGALANYGTLSSFLTPEWIAGALGQSGRQAEQDTRAAFAARGNAVGNQAVGAEILARPQYALSTLAGIQGAQQSGLSQLTGTEAAKTSAFAQTTNPILSFISNLVGDQTQANIAEANIGSQNAIASAQIQQKAFSDWINSMASVAGGAAMSDERVKKNIRKTGLETPEGIPMKTFEYMTRPGTRFLGVMAQDVEKKVPEAVVTDPTSGIKMVKFSKLKSPMLELGKVA